MITKQPYHSVMNLFSFAQQQLKRESWSRKPTKFESSYQRSKEAQARGNACDERIDNVMEGGVSRIPQVIVSNYFIYYDSTFVCEAIESVSIYSEHDSFFLSGPRLPENMFIKEIPEYKKYFFSKVLKSKSSKSP